MKNNYIYLLWHTHVLGDGEEDSKLLGVYSSQSLATQKIDEYKMLPGFRDYPSGFEISKYEIDCDHWKEGFITEAGDGQA